MRLPHPGQISVDPATGAFLYLVRDLTIPCRGNLQIKVERYHNSTSEHEINGILGVDHWSFNYHERLRFEYAGNQGTPPQPSYSDTLVIPPPDGETVPITLQAISIIYPNWASERFLLQNGSFVPAAATTRRTLTQNADGTYTVMTPSQGYHHFGADGYLIAEADFSGNAITYEWGTAPPPAPARALTAIKDPAGRTLTFTNTGTGVIITDWIGRTWTYNYHPADDFGTRISSFTDPDGNTTTYTYGMDFPAGYTDPVPSWLNLAAFSTHGVPQALLPLHGLYKITFPNGNTLINYAFGLRPLQKRVGVQIVQDRAAVLLAYDIANQATTRIFVDAITQTASPTTYQFDPLFRPTSVTDPLGNVTSYQYDANSNVTQIVDPRLGVTRFLYDTRNNMIQQTDALGNVTSYQYHPTLYEIVGITGPVPGTGTTTRTYDENTAAILSVTDRLGNTTSYGYDGVGQLVTTTRKNGGVDRFEHDPTTGKITSHTDPLGNVTATVFDEVGRLVSITTPEQRQTRFGSTPSGLMSSVTDPLGHTTAYRFDGNRNVIQVTDPLANVTKTGYSALNDPVSSTDALDHTTTMNRDGKGQVTSVVDALGHTTTFQRDLIGRVTALIDAAGKVTATAYDPYCGTVTTTDPLGRVSSITKDLLCRITRVEAADGSVATMTYNADGTLATVTDPLGHVTTRSYDGMGRLVAVTDALGRTRTMAYDASGNLIQTTDARGHATAFAYDMAGRLTGITRRDGSSVAYEYDRDGKLIRLTDARGKVWQWQYDGAGRLITSTNPLGQSRQKVYDAAGRVIQTVTPLGRTVAMAYDAVGRLTQVTDPLGNESQRVYDAFGNLTEVVDALGRVTKMAYDELNRNVQTTDPLGGVVAVTLDAVGNAVQVTDPNGNATSYEHDQRNRVTAEIYPDGSRTGYGYDAAGRLVSKSDPRGLTTTYGYDAADQLATIERPDSATVQLTRDANGNVVERVDGTGTYRRTFDAADRPVAITPADGGTYAIVYDAAGRPVQMTFPDGRTKLMSYDDAGRVATLTGPDGGVARYDYDADGRRAGLLQPNGVATMMQYDLASRLTRLVSQVSGLGHNIGPDFRPSYDAVGNMLALSDGDAPMWAYGYDGLDRLVSAVDKRSGSASAWTYDANGNRLTQTVDGLVTAYAYNALNQLVSAGSTAYSYDAAGNLAKKVAPGLVHAYTFDSRNRLLAVDMGYDTVRYTYDNAGRMITRTDASGTRTFEWNGWDLQREIGPDGLVTRYLLNGSRMIGFQQGETTYRLATDWLGSVRVITDQNATVVSQFDYDAWGNLLGSSFDGVVGGWAYRFVGGLGVRHDSTTGLHYMRNRWYDAELGRFIAEDPIPKGNRYSYGNASPVRKIDPLGLDTVDGIQICFSKGVPDPFKGTVLTAANDAIALIENTTFHSQAEIFSHLTGQAGDIRNIEVYVKGDAQSLGIPVGNENGVYKAGTLYIMTAAAGNALTFAETAVHETTHEIDHGNGVYSGDTIPRGSPDSQLTEGHAYAEQISFLAAVASQSTDTDLRSYARQEEKEYRYSVKDPSWVYQGYGYDKFIWPSWFKP